MGERSVATASPRIAYVSFDQELVGLRKLVIRGFLLTLATIGLYRFWYITDLRRYFWSHILIDGSPASYSGRAKELFVGALIAAGIIVAIQAPALVVAFLFPALVPFGGVLLYVLISVLLPFAIYRARRYRARRTSWRGMRLGQDGSALVYALIAAGWWLLILATLGLSFPFMRAALERYRIGHTLVGTSRLQSKAQGRRVLLPWIVIWLVIVSPILLLIGIGVTAKICVISIEYALLESDHAPFALDMALLDPCFLVEMYSKKLLGVLFSAVFIFVPLLYPYYRAREIRAFTNAIHLKEAALVSTLTARTYYAPYFTYLARNLKLAGWTTAAAAVVIVMALLLKDLFEQTIMFTFAGVIVISFYVWYGVNSIVIYVQVLKAGQLRAVAESLSIVNADALDAVLATAQLADGGLGEGLADALDPAGALEIGL